MSFAKRQTLIPFGAKNSSSKIRPGCTIKSLLLFMINPLLLQLRFNLNQFSLYPPLQKPSSPHPIVVDPGDGAAAGFGVVVVALNLFVPPATGKYVGTGEFINAAVFMSQDEPTILMRMTRPGWQ